MSKQASFHRSWAFAVLTFGAVSTAAADEALTTNQPADTLSVVDLKTMKEVSVIKVGGKPAGIALSPDRSLAYVTAPDSKELIEVDAVARTVKRRLALGGAPLGVAAHPSKPEVYVADWYAHKVSVIDAERMAVVAEIPVGNSPSGLAVTPDGRLLLSADRDSDAVSIIDIAGRKQIESVSVGSRPFGITIDTAGQKAYTANVKSNDVTVIDIAERRVLGSLPTGRRPYAVALTGNLGFVTDQYGGTVTVFDLTTIKVVKTIDACDHPEGIEADQTSGSIYIACWGDNQLIRLDPETLTVVGKAKVGDGPRAFGKFLR